MEVVLLSLSVVVGKSITAGGVDGALRGSRYSSHHRSTPELR